MFSYIFLPSFIIFHQLSTSVHFFHVFNEISIHTQWLLQDGFVHVVIQTGNFNDKVKDYTSTIIYNHLPCTIVKHVHHVHVIFHSTAFFMTSSATGCSSYWDMPVCDDTMLRSRVPTSAFASLVTSTNGYIIDTVWLRYTSGICQLSSYKCLCNIRHGRLGVHGCTQMCWFSSHPNSKRSIDPLKAIDDIFKDLFSALWSLLTFHLHHLLLRNFSHDFLLENVWNLQIEYRIQIKRHNFRCLLTRLQWIKLLESCSFCMPSSCALLCTVLYPHISTILKSPQPRFIMYYMQIYLYSNIMRYRCEHMTYDI